MKKREEKMYDLESLMRSIFRQLRNEINVVLGSVLSRNEFIILKSLKENGPQNASNLAKELDVSASHITAVTDSLLSKALITRKRSPNDRRITLIDLTEDGQTVLSELEKRRQSIFPKDSTVLPMMNCKI